MTVATEANTVQRAVVSWSGLSTNTEVNPPGCTLKFAWEAVPGANEASIESAGLFIEPCERISIASNLTFDYDDNDSLIISIPTKGHIRSLIFHGLADKTGAELKFTQDQPLVVQFQQDTPIWLPQIFTVPLISVDPLPTSPYAGATFKDNTLGLPDIVASKIRLTVVEGNFPKLNPSKKIKVNSINATIVNFPANLKLTELAGNEIWSMMTQKVKTVW